MNEWVDKPERSNLWTIRLIFFLALRLGRRFCRGLLYPITFYFVLLSRGGYRQSKAYLSRVLDREPDFRDVFRHYYTFAACLLDNVYIAAGQYHRFDISMHDNGLRQRIANDAAGRRGSIFLSAHLGSFYAMRMLGEKYGISVSAMMYQAERSKIMQVLSEQEPDLKHNLIDLAGPGPWMQAESRLSEGTGVAILADRAISKSHLMALDFLGSPAIFPAGPIYISGILDAPVYTVFTLYKGGNRYEIYVDLLDESVNLDRASRQKQALPYLQKYVGTLEKYCRLTPYNWFNFYDFWSPAEEQSK